MIGLDPGAFTLRELMLMQKGKAQHDWRIASTHLCLLANINRDPKKGRVFRPEDFDPTREPVSVQDLPRAGVEVLKQAIIDGKANQVVKEHQI